ncbi:hypothetical protein [Sorangium sp. So ce1151]|uniref:hypothetical protein n=1 Tax=Sorangium sp. So ce1151 TaxID=3133332 RepID=UPI003F6089BF
MNRIDDPRAVFYLRHQELIEEWAALGEPAAELAHAFLCSCADDIAGLAAELSPDIQVYKDLEDDWPKIFLILPEWLESREGELEPKVGIGLEWHRSRHLNFTMSPSCAYTGVWTHYDRDDGKELSRRLRAAFGEADLIKQHKLATTTAWWPAYRYEHATGEYWNDLGPYRAQIVESLRFFWTVFEPHIRKVLAG